MAVGVGGLVHHEVGSVRSFHLFTNFETPSFKLYVP